MLVAFERVSVGVARAVVDEAGQQAQAPTHRRFES
jgi:hypothetical protein